MIIGIVVALPAEVSSLTHTKVSQGDSVFIDDETLVFCSGVGYKNAAKAAQLLIDKGAKRLISWGCATALRADLKSGDLVIPSTLCAATNEQFSRFTIASSWLDNTRAHLATFKPFNGALAESHTIVATTLDKQRIYQQTRAVALDMESVAIAQVAQKNNINVLVIRCIADPVSLCLPRAVCYALNQQGDIIIRKLLLFLCTHPYELPRLIKLWFNFNTAKNRLKLVAKQLDSMR